MVNSLAQTLQKAERPTPEVGDKILVELRRLFDREIEKQTSTLPHTKRANSIIARGDRARQLSLDQRG